MAPVAKGAGGGPWAEPEDREAEGIECDPALSGVNVVACVEEGVSGGLDMLGLEVSTAAGLGVTFDFGLVVEVVVVVLFAGVGVEVGAQEGFGGIRVVSCSA